MVQPQAGCEDLAGTLKIMLVWGIGWGIIVVMLVCSAWMDNRMASKKDACNRRDGE